MSKSMDFVDRVIDGFRSLRERPHFDVLAQQFETGEVSFIVDCNGIRVYLDEEAVPDSQETDFPTG